MKTKKAQMEIIGLLVIVIMLAVLSVIFLTFALREQPSTTAILRTSTKADNLLNSIIRTSAPEDIKMLDLISESYSKSDFLKLRQEFSNVMSKTISNRQYSFKIEINQEKALEMGTCSTGISSVKTIKHQENTFKFNLLIC